MTLKMLKIGDFRFWDKDGLERLPKKVQDLIKDCQIYGRGLGPEHPEEAWFYHLEGETLHRTGQVTAGADVISRKYPLVKNGLYLGRSVLRILTAHGVMMGLVGGHLVFPSSFDGHKDCDYLAGCDNALSRVLNEHVRIVRHVSILLPPNVAHSMKKLKPFKEKNLVMAGMGVRVPTSRFLNNQDQCVYTLIDWDLSYESDDFVATYLTLDSIYYTHQDEVRHSALRPMVTVDKGVITGFFGPSGFVELKKYMTDPWAAIDF